MTTKVVFVYEDDRIGDAVKAMVEAEVGSILVASEDQFITGIVTERDIVRKFTLLDVDDKMDRKVRTFMSRPVKFVDIDSLEEDMLKLFQKHNLRHFPILSGVEQTKENVVGMVSVTDLIHRYLTKDKAPKIKSDGKPIELFVLAKAEGIAKAYPKMFEQLGYKITLITDFHVFSKKNPQATLLFDMDGYTNTQLKELIPPVKAFGGHLILVTSNSQLESVFRNHLNRDRQVVMIKPINVSYCHWLLSHNWGVPTD